MNLGLGLPLGAPGASAAGGGGGGANPNLILWTEAFDNAVWIKTRTSVLPDQGVNGEDEIVSLLPAASIAQTSTTAATGALVSKSVTPSGTVDYVRVSVTGTFSGLPYTYSVELRDAGGGEPLTLTLDVLGGFLRVSHLEAVGDGDYLARNAQLEQATGFTTYHSRGGT